MWILPQVQVVGSVPSVLVRSAKALWNAWRMTGSTGTPTPGQRACGEIIAQQIENKTHLPVERRFYLAGTYICQQAILGGRIDIYPEYTGTALTAILKSNRRAIPPQVYNQVKTEYAQAVQSRTRPAFRIQ